MSYTLLVADAIFRTSPMREFRSVVISKTRRDVSRNESYPVPVAVTEKVTATMQQVSQNAPVRFQHLGLRIQVAHAGAQLLDVPHALLQLALEVRLAFARHLGVKQALHRQPGGRGDLLPSLLVLRRHRRVSGDKAARLRCLRRLLGAEPPTCWAASVVHPRIP